LKIDIAIALFIKKIHTIKYKEQKCSYKKDAMSLNKEKTKTWVKISTLQTKPWLVMKSSFQSLKIFICIQELWWKNVELVFH
jgi:hypothetical protein